MGYGAKIVDKVKNDANFTRLGKGVVLGARGIRAGAGRYFTNKVPIVQWIPAYSPKWLLGDIIAGQSTGMLLIPQALTYSLLAGVPIQSALLASWLPGFIYALMGTSRDISIGPTFSSAIFTGKIVLSLAKFRVPAPLVAAVVSFSVGIWALLFGILNLGFIFDLISIPMALAVVMGSSFFVITLQLPVILGLTDIPPDFMAVMPAIIKQIGQTKPMTFGIGAVSILILAILQFVGKKWGRRMPILGMITTSRNLFVLGTFTGVSYFVNKDLQQPLWANLGPIKTSIPSPSMPVMKLVQSLFVPSLALFASISLEHIALAKAFGTDHKYKIDQSQEMVAVGAINLLKSMFGALPVGGGDMARASVNAVSGVRSPLGGILSSVTVFGIMYAASGIFQYLPQATVAAVIIVAIVDKMPPQAIIGKYWTISFVDFIHFILAFNFTMLNDAMTGLGLSIVFMIGYTLMRIMFSRPTPNVSSDLEDQYNNLSPPWWHKGDRIPAGTQVITLETDVIFTNAERIKRHILNTVYTFQSGIPSDTMAQLTRPWNVRMDKHIASLRKTANINSADTFLPRIRVLVLDLSSTSFVDASGMLAFQQLKDDIRAYGGENVELRFVGLNKGVKRRFERAGWMLENPYEGQIEVEGEERGVKDLVFEFLPHAIVFQASDLGTYELEEVGDMKKF